MPDHARKYSQHWFPFGMVTVRPCTVLLQHRLDILYARQQKLTTGTRIFVCPTSKLTGGARFAIEMGVTVNWPELGHMVTTNCYDGLPTFDAVLPLCLL